MDTKRWIFLGFSAALLLILALVFFRGGGGERIKASAEMPPPSVTPEPGPPTETKFVTLFFPSEQDSLLHSETREILASASVAEEAKRVVEELIKGSERGYLSPFPPETRLRQLFITREGVAYVDFSRDIMDKHLSGSSAELATVYSVVNSLAFNFRPIKRVFILVEGEEKETLGGHINLSRAFLPLYSLNSE
ncbi:MAG: GerMN domain-containing protein [Clostridiales bacterium]|jgi:spore germination protein GerM|nr:GerMN domain-containing protein [Clostridiales bacterium]